MRLKEITRAPSWDSGKDTVKDPIETQSPTVAKIPSNTQPFPGYPDLGYYWTTKGSLGFRLGTYQVLSVINVKNRQVAGRIYLSSADDVIPGAVETSDLFVYDDYQRQGIAGNMYRLLTVDLGQIIFGDRDPEGGQTPEARQLWIKMAQGGVPGVIVKGYVVIDIDSSSFASFDEDIIVNAIMKLGGEWLYHDDRKWVVAFNTMPNQARSELIAAVKTVISGKIYMNPQRGDYGDLVEEAGLVAMSQDRFQSLTGLRP